MSITGSLDVRSMRTMDELKTDKGYGGEITTVYNKYGRYVAYMFNSKINEWVLLVTEDQEMLNIIDILNSMGLKVLRQYDSGISLEYDAEAINLLVNICNEINDNTTCSLDGAEFPSEDTAVVSLVHYLTASCAADKNSLKLSFTLYGGVDIMYKDIKIDSLVSLLRLFKDKLIKDKEKDNK